ncbi:hypothetical protein ACFE04_011478 [Oxalis oulophora]
MSKTTRVGMEVSPVNRFHSATRVPNLPLSSIKTFPYQEMLKLFIVSISKSEGGLWAFCCTTNTSCTTRAPARLSRRDPESVPEKGTKGPLASCIYPILNSWEADRAKASSFRPLFPK